MNKNEQLFILTKIVTSFFPKRFLSWGVKTLFASASSCQCKPLNFFRRLGYVGQVSIGGDPRGAQDLDRAVFFGWVGSLAATFPD